MLSNLAWLAVCMLVFTVTTATVRRGSARVSSGTAFTTAFVLCLVLLPIISMSDDLLENRQATLPLAAQSWHLASVASSVGLEVASLLGGWLLFLAIVFAAVSTLICPIDWEVRPYAAWLARAQRLRPPPSCAL